MSELARILRESSAKKQADASNGIGSLSDIFEYEPVPLREFIESKKYLNGVKLSPVQLDVIQHVERVYYDGWFLNEDTGERYYDPSKDLYSLMAKGGMSPYWSKKVRMVNYVTLQWG